MDRSYDAVQQALRLYVKAGDRLAQVEAQVQGNVMSDFHLSSDWRGQAKRLFLARFDLNLALEGVAKAVADTERQTDAPTETENPEVPTEA